MQLICRQRNSATRRWRRPPTCDEMGAPFVRLSPLTIFLTSKKMVQVPCFFVSISCVLNENSLFLQQLLTYSTK